MSSEVDPPIVLLDERPQSWPDRGKRPSPRPVHECLGFGSQRIRLRLEQSARACGNGEQPPQSVDLLIAEDLAIALGGERNRVALAQGAARSGRSSELVVAIAGPRVGGQLLPSEEDAQFIDVVLAGLSTQVFDQREPEHQRLEIFHRTGDGRQIADDAATEPRPDSHRTQGVDRPLHLGA